MRHPRLHLLRHAPEEDAGRCVGRSSISAQSPTPKRTSLLPDPGWNLAPLPLCMQYRWQDRRACWCRKAVPVLRRWQGGKALAEKGHQDQCSPLPWSQLLFQRLLGIFGKRRFSLLNATIQVFKGSPSSPQIVPCLMKFFSSLWTAAYLPLASLSIPVDLINTPPSILQGN